MDIDPNKTRAMREWTLRTGGSKTKETARTPFQAAVKAVKRGAFQSLGLIIQADAKGVETSYCGTERVFKAAGKKWPYTKREMDAIVKGMR